MTLTNAPGSTAPVQPRPDCEYAFERTIVEALTASDWHEGERGKGAYNPELGLDTAQLWTFLGATQPAALERLKEFTGEAGSPEAAGIAMREFGKLLAREIDARGTLDVLRNGVKDRGLHIELAYFRPAHAIAEDAFHNYRSNRLTVTPRLRYAPDHTRELDLVLFLNGLPLATAELKSSASQSPQNVEDAKHQYRTTRDPKDLIFAKRALVHFAVDEMLVFLTTRLQGEKTLFLPFNQGSKGPGNPGGAGNPPLPDSENGPAYRTAYLWEEVWQPDNWMAIVKRFLHVEDPRNKKGAAKSGRPRRVSVHNRTLIFPRYHQWDAVRRLTNHAAYHGSGQNYLVEHSAGSGKSNTIGWLAHHLSVLHGSAEPGALDPKAVAEGRIEADKPVFHKIVVVTDRTVLDDQLQDTIYQFDHTPGVVRRVKGTEGAKSQQVAQALGDTGTKIIIVTAQTFPHILEGVTGLQDKRIAIIVDEAHSGQTGSSVPKMRKVLRGLGAEEKAGKDEEEFLTSSAAARQMHPMLSYFAFTATPKKKTLNLFGVTDPDSKLKRGFHIYSMKQAIEEGFILDPLRNYTRYTTHWRVAKDGAEQIEVDEDKAKGELAKFVYLNPTTLAQHAEIIVEHFAVHGRRRLGGRAKAMVVTRSRQAAYKMYEHLVQATKDLDCADLGVLVAFSGELEVEKEIDGVVTEVKVTEAELNGVSEKELPDAFAYTRADDRYAALRTGRPGGAPPRTEYRMLVVAEKYQTGFDQPLLTHMYIEKPLTDVAAVQTLSRLNRTHPRKSQEDLFVLDFVNDPEDIKKEYAPYFKEARTEPADVNLLYISQREVTDHQLLYEDEMEAFVRALAAAQAADGSASVGEPGARRWEKAHAGLYRHTDAARARFVERQEQDRDAAEEFRADLRGFLRQYGFLSQLMPRVDIGLERLYLYGKHLANILPPPPYDPSLDIGEMDLTHMRVTKVGDYDISLTDDDVEDLAPYGAEGAGGHRDPAKILLSELIEEFNVRYGLGLSEADRVMYEERIVAAAGDPDLEDAAVAARNEGDFEHPFNKRFRDIMIERAEADTKFTERYFSDAEFQGQLLQEARTAAYRLIRRRHNLPDTR
ncbi:type I restriction endonuclease subunit R [Streptomyces sp. FR-008]|uniref:type I restriction endonuclease subunit R n=1 Tax=Streptomyces sp. FR-008 TaxID=206662 RepID=UPI00096B470A|nr:DEAD/DEAH box helicase family protein [Streptomyces sp. FR-008]